MKHERKLTCGLAVWFLAQWFGIAHRAVGQEQELVAPLQGEQHNNNVLYRKGQLF